MLLNLLSQALYTLLYIFSCLENGSYLCISIPYFDWGPNLTDLGAYVYININ